MTFRRLFMRAPSALAVIFLAVVLGMIIGGGVVYFTIARPVFLAVSAERALIQPDRLSLPSFTETRACARVFYQGAAPSCTCTMGVLK